MTQVSNFPVLNVTEGNDVTILNGQQTSSAIQCRGTSLVGVIVPAAWTIADITIQVSLDGKTFFDWRDYETGNPLIIVASAVNAAYRTLPVDFAGAEHLKLISSVVQASDVNLTCMLRPV